MVDGGKLGSNGELISENAISETPTVQAGCTD